MDVNASRFHLRLGPAEVAVRSSRLQWDTMLGGLALARQDLPRVPRGAPAAAPAWAARQPRLMDTTGGWLRLAEDGQSLRVWQGKALAGETATRPLRAVLDDAVGVLATVTPARGRFSEVAIGGSEHDRLAVVAVDGVWAELVLVHLRQRWVDRVDLPFVPERVWVADDDRVWLAGAGQLAIAAGGPLAMPWIGDPATFIPEPANPHPLRLVAGPVALPAAGAVLGLVVDHGPLPGDAPAGPADSEDGDQAAGEAGATPLKPIDDGRLALLLAGAERAVLFLRSAALDDAKAAWSTHPLPDGLTPASDLAPAPVALAGAADAFVVLVSPAAADGGNRARDLPLVRAVARVPARGGQPEVASHAELLPVRVPTRAPWGPRLVHAADGEVRYATADGAQRAVALAQIRRHGVALSKMRRGFDSGMAGCCWHRLVLEGGVPAGTSLRIHARASDLDPDDPAHAAAWSALHWEAQPAPAWCGLPSELPWHPGLVAPADDPACARGRSELLLQSQAGASRRLVGRHLQLAIAMTGDGRATPWLTALRVHLPRFDYQERYLPAYLHQTASAGGAGAANGADLRERVLALAEGLFTEIEGRVAAAETLLDPAAIAIDQLPHLGRLVGLRPDPSWPPARQRRLLAVAGDLLRQRGTLAGVRLAVDIATDGAVARGEVVIVENHRLRRSMATLLGVDFDDQQHPLTLGTMTSGNSIVGDALILSEPAARAFLALYGEDAATGREAAAVDAFFAKYSHRVSVLLHGRAKSQRALVEQALASALPAHVPATVFATDTPFVLGLSPLLAVDTFLQTEPPPGVVVVQRSRLGRGDLLRDPPAFATDAAGADATLE